MRDNIDIRRQHEDHLRVMQRRNQYLRESIAKMKDAIEGNEIDIQITKDSLKQWEVRS